jgi:hypothetical protein
LVILAGIFVLSLFVTAALLHIRDIDGWRRLEAYVHGHLWSSIAVIVIFCCLVFGTGVYLYVHHPRQTSEAQKVSSPAPAAPSAPAPDPAPSPKRSPAPEKSRALNVTKAREHLSISPKQTPAPGLTQSNSGGTNVQQSTTGPNSPNIAGNDNQVNYADTSELPILSQSQLAEITKQMSSFKYKLIIHFNMSDREATVLANDLVVALKAAGWDANYLAGMGGGGIQNSVPIVMGVKTKTNPHWKLAHFRAL